MQERMSPVLLVFPAIAFGLGSWQVYRKQWKEELIAAIEGQLKADPVPLPAE